MRQIRYFDGTRVRRLAVQGVFEGRQQRARTSPHHGFVNTPAFAAMRPQASGERIVESLSTEADRLKSRFRAFSEQRTEVVPVEQAGETTVVLTETVAIDNARKADTQWLKRTYGLVVVEEGTHGKVLMRVPDAAEDPVGLAAEAALALHERGGPATAHPNFLRVVQRTPLPSAAPLKGQWGLDNVGTPGVIGADVGALGAWTVTKGKPEIRVAILDEGVDTAHPYLKPAVVAEKDFVDDNPTASPDGDDAHGTACAGIVVSRDSRLQGLAPGASLVAARIAKSDAQGFWIFDDFATADAIDWCWDTAKADVLSNSWGGGPPAPVITRAFDRARTQGRGGKGSVVVVAAGNDQRPVDYPGNLPDVVGVGASNQWDKRKTKTSQDGESWWGSNFGKGLALMAPGVGILTTDISGRRGYTGAQTTERFNGTSSATPFVAAAVALMLSANPSLTERRVRDLLVKTADPLDQQPGKWNQNTGYGRLDAYRAVRAARRG
jgi:subtilisin family serine protease